MYSLKSCQNVCLNDSYSCVGSESRFFKLVQAMKVQVTLKFSIRKTMFKTIVMLSRHLELRYSFLEKDTVTVVGRHVVDKLRNFYFKNDHKH